MSYQTTDSRAALDKMYAFIAQHNGGIDPRRTHNLAPSVVQTIEDKIQQSNDFLKQISFLPTRDLTGQVVSLMSKKSITKRTSTDTGTSLGKRRPTNPMDMADRDFLCRPIQQDSLIPWSYIDQWSHLADFYPRVQQYIRFIRMRDYLRMMWYGQTAVADTDIDTYPLLQDVQRGFIQYMIDKAPEQVEGIIKDTSAAGGYRIDPIRIGPGAGDNGYESLDEAAFYLRDIKVDKLLRQRTSNRIIAGDKLLVTDKGQLAGVPNSKPVEKNAALLLMRINQIGELERTKSDEFPDFGLMVFDPSDLQHLWQSSSVRVKYDEDSHEQMGVVNYYYKNCDNVVANPEGCALIHPDAIELPTGYDDTGKATGWARAADAWNIWGV